MIPKLSQRESNTDVDVDVDNVDLEIFSFWLHEAWFQKCLENKEV